MKCGLLSVVMEGNLRFWKWVEEEKEKLLEKWSCEWAIVGKEGSLVLQLDEVRGARREEKDEIESSIFFFFPISSAVLPGFIQTD